MNRLSNYEKVREFHEVFGMKDPEEIVIPGDKIQRLRFALILEELKELVEEFGYKFTWDLEKVEDKDIIIGNVAKEMADLLYVVYGAAANFGIPIDDVFEEVHSSNLSKLDDNGKPIFRDDGKIMKSHNYRPADVERVLGFRKDIDHSLNDE